MKKIIILVSIIFLTISCQREELPLEENIEQNTSLDKHIESEFSNWELIQNELKIYQESASRLINSETYFCSEDMGYGTYNTLPYINNGVYINEFYCPSNTQKYCALPQYIENRFNSSNPSGSNSSNFNFQFEVYGANGGTFLSQHAANRVYNEFVCQLYNEFPSNTGNASRPRVAVDVLIDYLLCCDGSSCCNPVFIANGTIYWD